MSETRRIAEQGDAYAQFKLGYAYFYGEQYFRDIPPVQRIKENVPKNPGEGIRWWHKSAEGDEQLAMEYLGYAYYCGGDVGRDYKEAVKWFRKSTPTEFGYAEFFLGECYSYGRGVQQDYAEAARWLLAALNTDAGPYDDICHLLSRIYALDDAVKQCLFPNEGEDGWLDHANDAKWCHESAEGNRYFQFCLGLAYAYGRGVGQNDAEAVRWWHKAADAIVDFGRPDSAAIVWAQFHLAVAYEKGRGVLQNYVQAYMRLTLASKAEVRDEMSPSTTGEVQKYAFHALDELALKMTPEQIAEAQRLAREWTPSNSK